LNLQISTNIGSLLAPVFLQVSEVEVGHFFVAMAKKAKILRKSLFYFFAATCL
jgi:hypothetical protein